MRSILEILQDARRLMIAGEYLELVACLVELQGHRDFDRFTNAVLHRGYSASCFHVVRKLLELDMRHRVFQDGIYDLALFADQNEWRAT